MTPEMTLDLWRLFMTFISIIATGVALWAAAFLRRMAAAQDARAELNAHRDAQRDEMQENVRRIANGLSIHSEEPTSPPDAIVGASDHRARNAAQSEDNHSRRVARTNIAATKGDYSAGPWEDEVK